MTKKEKLDNLIKVGEDFIGKNLNNSDSKFNGWNASVIRFIEKEFGKDSSDAKRLRNRLYQPSAYGVGVDNSKLFNKVFEKDLNNTLEELRLILDDIDDFELIDIINNELYKKSSTKTPTLNVNINNTNTNIVDVNITFDTIVNSIENDSKITEEDRNEVLEKITEIEKILNNKDKTKKQKWSYIKVIVAFLLDKGTDFAIVYLPQILIWIRSVLNG